MLKPSLLPLAYVVPNGKFVCCVHWSIADSQPSVPRRLGDLGELRREFNKNTEARDRDPGVSRAFQGAHG